MGQQATAVMFGVVLKDKIAKLLYADDSSGLLDKPDALTEGSGRVETSENGEVFGITIAVSNGNEDGEPSFPPYFRASQAAKAFRTELKDAKARWKALAKALAEKSKGKAKLGE